jgi:ArsR family transcriptional regulator, arsenate/arsenite/antimonite-responsive transcriptional repressor
MRYRAYADEHVGDFPMQSVVRTLAALAEPTRLAALAILWDGSEHCVCDLVAKLGASQSRMSHHLSVLRAAGLVVDRRDAQWVRYRRNPKLSPSIARIIDAVVRAGDYQVICWYGPIAALDCRAAASGDLP